MNKRLSARRLARRRLRYPSLLCIPELMPLNDIEWLATLDPAATCKADKSKADFQWLSAGDDPQFLLLGSRPLAGWNMLELIMEHDQPRAAMRVYFNTGKGFNDEQSIFLPLRQGKMTKRICFVPYGTRAIRLDPLESEGHFSISHLRFVWLTPWFAYNRIAQRLGGIHSKYKGLNPSAVLSAIKREAREEGLSWKKLSSAYYEETFMHCAPEKHYQYWVDHIERLREPDSADVEVACRDFAQRPLVSVVISDRHVPLDWIRESVSSVLEQRYERWELCVATHSDQNSERYRALAEITAIDTRLSIVRREAGNSDLLENMGLEWLQGEYVVFLNGADRLSRNALYHIVDSLERHPRAAFLYGDEDDFDHQGRRFNPHFKPQWNPDLILAQDYIGRSCAFRVDRLRSLGGLRPEFGAKSHHDLLLRFSEGLEIDEISHIPFVLYHRRFTQGLADDDASVSQVALGQEWQCAVDDYLARKYPGASVEHQHKIDGYRIVWPLPDPLPLVSLLVPTRDRVDILRPCVDAILALTDYERFELLILDNQSSCPETLDYMKSVESDPRVRILRWDQPFNYSAINNFGVEQARGDIIGLVNNDIEPINDGWLSEMVRQVCRPEIGCVGAKLYYPNGTIQHGGVILGLGGVAGHAHRFFPRDHRGYRNRLNLVHNLSAVTAACLLVRKSVFEEVDGLNEEHLSIAYNDVDFCLKVREAGYRNLWTPYAELYHHESVSRGVDDNPQKRARAQHETDYMREVWGEKLDNDPAYNPNLTLIYEDFSLR